MSGRQSRQGELGQAVFDALRAREAGAPPRGQMMREEGNVRNRRNIGHQPSRAADPAMRCGGSNIAAMTRPASRCSRTARSPAPGAGQAAQSRGVGCDQEPLAGLTGIGHTRWATHGAPTETNAHPHMAGDVVIVHNGIIENFAELKRELIAEGASSKPRPIPRSWPNWWRGAAKGKSPREAVRTTLARLEGAFALAIMFRGEQDLLIGARKGCAARGRPWRRRDVPRQRCDGARALHQPHHLSRRRRLGGADPRLRARSSTVADRPDRCGR